jgi:hypothetical protein
MLLVTKFDKNMLHRICPTKLDIFIGFQNLRSRMDISDVSDIFDL